MKNIITGILLVILAATGAALVIQQQARARLRQENDTLREQSAQLARLQAENEQLASSLAQANASARGQNTELLKLRNEVAMLRKQTGEMADLQAKNQQLNAALANRRNAPPAKPPPETAPKINPPADTAADAATGPDLGAVQLVNVDVAGPRHPIASSGRGAQPSGRLPCHRRRATAATGCPATGAGRRRRRGGLVFERSLLLFTSGQQ